MKKLIMAILISLFFISVAHGAESVTQSLQTGGEINVLVMEWTTDASGNLTATDTGYPIEGYLMLVETVPSATAVPTSYAVTLTNASSIDVMGGALAGRSTTATEMSLPLLNGNYTMLPVPGTLSMDVTGAGASKSGIVRIYFVR